MHRCRLIVVPLTHVDSSADYRRMNSLSPDFFGEQKSATAPTRVAAVSCGKARLVRGQDRLVSLFALS